MDRHYYVYIMASGTYGTLYVGVTSNLVKRAWEHKNDFVDGFTRRTASHRLVWYEVHDSIYEAIPAKSASRNGIATGRSTWFRE